MLARFITSPIGSRLLIPKPVFAHTKTCPSGKKKVPCGAATSSGGGGGGGGEGGGAYRKPDFKRGEPGKVRMVFLPENWFTFFYNKTGVSGPYLLIFNLSNYLISKEIYIMEHEYYLGLSALVMVTYVYKNFSEDIAASLDQQVDELQADYEKGRKADIAFHEENIKLAKQAQACAEGQKLLMDAKKENIAMQLEAVYRERAMLVYQMVRGRMDYHVKRYQAEARIHQKWMIGWILQSVRKSITPEFEQQALNSAIQDLAAAASRAQ